jgi:putative transposase
LTLVTEGRKPWFEGEAIVRLCSAELNQAAARESFALLAYVFMPEHLHLLIQGQEQSRLSFFIKDFKQRTGFHFKRDHGEALWQKSYHDHALRNDEGLEDAALYIARNPIRRGLAAEWTQYAFWGGVLLRDLAGDLKVAATSHGAITP